MKTFGYDLERLERENKVRIVDIEGLKSIWLSSNVQSILDTVANMKAERLVIDSVTALFIAREEKFDYKTLIHLSYRILETQNCTTIMTCSIPTGQKNPWDLE